MTIAAMCPECRHLAGRHALWCSKLPASIDQRLDVSLNQAPMFKSQLVDPVVERVRADLHRRSQIGIRKYGTTLADNPAAFYEKLNHAYEEVLDLTNYLAWVLMELEHPQREFSDAFKQATTTRSDHPSNCECAECQVLMERG